MLAAVHLLIGVTLGIFLLYLTRDCRALIYCAIGSLLPDIIDKPVGHIILASLDNGRIFFHSLSVCALVALLGVILLIKWRHPGLLFVAAGMLSHQFADAMWNMPQSWYWPFLGSFPPKDFPVYFKNIFFIEFSSPSELLLLALGFIIVLCLVQTWRTGNIRLIHWTAGVVGLLLIVTGAVVLSGLTAGILPVFLVYSQWLNILIYGLSLVMGGVAFLLVSLSPPIWCGIRDFL